ncbi:MAG: hypothetical protein WBB01_03360, partial [Phormidesmis sp.]
MTKPSERTKPVRLSSAAFRGFRPERLTLQVKPLQGLVGKLSGGKRTGTTPPAVSDVDTNLSSPKSSKGTQVAFNLLLVRPWVLVVSFWLVSMVSAGIALEGLISPRKLTTDMPAASVPVTPKDSFISVEPSADEIAGQPVNPDPETVFIAPAETRRSSFPAWPLGALVGTCAAGCLVMSRRRAMARMAAARSRSALRNESRSRIRKVQVSSDSRPTAARPTAARPTATVQPTAR